jgi:molybdopterin/thiamine biosynthesis adenylyltransferase
MEGLIGTNRSSLVMEEPLRIGAQDDEVFDRSRRIGWLDLESVSNARVMMVGAGALGNEVGKNLALSGFRRLTIVDMDHVVGSNLNRCLFFTREDARMGAKKAEVVAQGISKLSTVAEPIALNTRIEDVPDSVLREQSLILGCLDNIQARLHVNSHAYSLGKVYVDGGMEGFIGRVTVVKPPNGACIQCGMNRSHAKVAEMRFSCTGKDVVFHEPRLAAEITTTSVISAIMVREALKIVSGRPEMSLSNSFYYDGQRNVSEEIEIPLDPSCPAHSSVD